MNSYLLQSIDDEHKNFILDVVSGCIEHKKLLDVVIDLFYEHHGKGLSRGDHSLYVVVCYLITFVLEDLGLTCFGVIVKSLGLKKVHTFLNFFFTNLITYIQEKWNTMYDAAYVKKHLIIPLLRWRPEVDLVMDQLAAKVSHRHHVKKAPMKTTEPQEFALTKPKPRPLPMPEPIPQQEKHKPVSLIYSYRVGKQNLQYFESTWPVKLNSAAILRQGAIFDRQVEEELQRVECLVQGAQEPSSFLQWQKEMREKDKLEELAKIERRRLEGRISYEEAAMARTRIMECNQKAAKLKKEETAEIMRRYAEKRLKEEKEMRDLVQQVAEGHKNSKFAKEKIQALKRSIVKEVSEQSQELLRQALEEAQAELSRRFEIIREIHALESVPHIRHKYFDDTETAGHELLGEMSLAELRERLGLLKEAQQMEQQEKWEHIQEEKHNKEQLLLQQLDTINLHRKALAQAAASRSGQSKLASLQTVTQDETVLALQKKLEEKQQERQRLKQIRNNKATTSEQTHTVESRTHSKKSSEEESWKDLERSLERHIQKDAAYVVSQRETLKT
uniref:Cilia and flagella associated protein 99 n=1 Tax=Sphaeramia orbicularis TaxID=375764 RepID=A0A672ZN82_9TELE